MTVDASMLLGNFSGGAMDLGLSGRHAIVCGSSRGLGFACAASLAREGAAVVMNGRDGRALDAAVRKVEVLAPGRVRGVVADVTTDAGRGALVGACPGTLLMPVRQQSLRGFRIPRPMARGSGQRSGIIPDIERQRRGRACARRVRPARIHS